VTPLAFALVVLAALIHASWNIAAKKASGGALFVALNVWVSTIVYAPVFALYAYFFPLQLGWRELLLLAGSGAIHLAYSLALQRGYQKYDLTVVYPVARGTGPLLSSVLAIVLFAEPVTLFSGLGILCIVLGIFVLAGAHRLLKNPSAHALGGVAYGALTGAFIAAYTLLDGYGVKYLLIAPLVLDYVCNVMRALFLAPTAWQRRDELATEWRKNRRYCLYVGVLGPVAYVLVLTAMQTAPISMVAPLREISMVFAAFLGASLLGEAHRAERLVGATLMAMGVSALLHG
jgi:drug/metabolite transporter (DMT)-like permease